MVSKKNNYFLKIIIDLSELATFFMFILLFVSIFERFISSQNIFIQPIFILFFSLSGMGVGFLYLAYFERIKKELIQQNKTGGNDE